MNATSSSLAAVVEKAPDTSVVALFDRFTDLTASITGGPVAMFDTVIATEVEVVWLPAASRARAASVCAPLAALVEFHAIVYGAVVTSAPTAAPSSRNCTPATATLSLADADTATADPLTVAPSAGAVIDTVGAVRSLFTVTLIGDVAVLPAASRAIALSVWPPFVVAVVFQVTPYGLVVTSAPRFAPSSLNWTPTTATLSAAFADTAALADTVDPPAGAAIDTVGGVVSLLTVTFTAADVAWLPAASRARAASVCAPLPTLPEFHVIEYGAVVTSAPTAAPSSRNCTPATPTLSDAVAETVTLAPATVAPLAGAVIDTVGGVPSTLFTVTLTAADVVELPAASRATAVSV